MTKQLAPGRTIFALGFAALGVLCFILNDFIVGRPPAWPANLHLNPALAYITGSLFILLSLTIIFNKYLVVAGYSLFVLILLLSFSRHLLHFQETWANAWKTVALLGACLIIAACGTVNLRSRSLLINVGCVLLASFLLVGGYAHFKYAQFVNTLIPDYIPSHSFFTYACGVFLIAGGIGIIIPNTRRIAALLCAIMIGGWFLLLHIPRFYMNPADTSDRLGLCESFAFCGVFLVLAAIAAAQRAAIKPTLRSN